MNTESKKASRRLRKEEIPWLIVCLILIPILIMELRVVICFRLHPGKVPGTFGVIPIISDSVNLEPDVGDGDLLIMKDRGEINTGDVIMKVVSNGEKILSITAKVMEKTQQNGETVYTVSSGTFGTETETLSETDMAEYMHMIRTIPVVGKCMLFMQTLPGLIIFAILPMTGLLVYNIIVDSRERKQEKKEKEVKAADPVQRRLSESLGD